ncbi:hypothetical protein [Brucella tritici]|uniref:Uncharacterized protein n=1 Tax=Brucella tritici TaxID=94626 RepID=A0A6L3YB29_9HYPH|nr:hypothetical protein [Brucella tritici]KAB2680068.1 hypothetical protein F9L08_21965 [Brucella tritici]
MLKGILFSFILPVMCFFGGAQTLAADISVDECVGDCLVHIWANQEWPDLFTCALIGKSRFSEMESWCKRTVVNHETSMAVLELL